MNAMNMRPPTNPFHEINVLKNRLTKLETESKKEVIIETKIIETIETKVDNTKVNELQKSVSIVGLVSISQEANIALLNERVKKLEDNQSNVDLLINQVNIMSDAIHKLTNRLKTLEFNSKY